VAPHLVDGAGRRVLALGLANGQLLVEWPSRQRAKPENEHRRVLRQLRGGLSYEPQKVRCQEDSRAGQIARPTLLGTTRSTIMPCARLFRSSELAAAGTVAARL
jgi:hypothetical protein